MKKVLENVIDRANKGIATPSDNEVLKYLSTVKLLKNRICGHLSSSEKISTPTKKQTTTSRPSTEHIESSVIPTTLATSLPETTREITRGTSRKTTLGTTRLTKFETTIKPSSAVPKRMTKAATETPAMIVDVDDGAVDVDNNILTMNDKFEEDRDEIEETHTVRVSLLKTSEADTELPTTPTPELPKKISTRRSKSPKPSKRPTRVHPSGSSKSPKPSKRPTRVRPSGSSKSPKPSKRPTRVRPSRRSSLSPRPSKRHTYGMYYF